MNKAVRNLITGSTFSNPTSYWFQTPTVVREDYSCIFQFVNRASVTDALRSLSFDMTSAFQLIGDTVWDSATGIFQNDASQVLLAGGYAPFTGTFTMFFVSTVDLQNGSLTTLVDGAIKIQIAYNYDAFTGVIIDLNSGEFHQEFSVDANELLTPNMSIAFNHDAGLIVNGLWIDSFSSAFPASITFNGSIAGDSANSKYIKAMAVADNGTCMSVVDINDIVYKFVTKYC